MIATSRIKRKFDHRLQAIVKSAGSIEVDIENGIPRDSVPRRPNVAGTKSPARQKGFVKRVLDV
jgi:hypothetical protein